MPSASGRTTSNWMETATVPAFPPLAADANAEVCIVGAGIAGLSTAYELLQRGRSVIVLDDNPIGGGESGRTTGHLSDALDEGYVALQWIHGAEGARLAFESHRDAIEHIEAIAREEGIDCDFDRVDGYLFAPEGESVEALDRELEACHRVGKADVAMVEGMPLEGLKGRRALKHPGQGQFHVLKYLAGLAEAIVRGGGRICTGTRVEGIEGGPSCTVATADGHTVTSRAVVVATNSPINDRVALQTKLYPYRSYVVALDVPAGAMAAAQYWGHGRPVSLREAPTGRGRGSPDRRGRGPQGRPGRRRRAALRAARSVGAVDRSEGRRGPVSLVGPDHRAGRRPRRHRRGPGRRGERLRRHRRLGPRA